MKSSYMAIDRTTQEETVKDARLRAAVKRYGMPMISDGRKRSDAQLVEKLAAWGISIDRARFEQLARPFLSAQELSDALAKNCNAKFNQGSLDHDWLWIALSCLWERWLPDRPSMEMIDDQMQAGYDSAEDRDEAEASRIWCQTWRNILRIIDERRMEGIAEFEDRFAGTQSVFNWLSDFEMALNNAGRDNPEFLQERMLFCRAFIERFPDFDQLMIENFKRSFADSLWQLGDNASADALYAEWLREDPRWGWGWIGWSDGHYLFAPEQQADPARAVDLLREGLMVSDVRDRHDMLDRLADLYDQLGRTEEAQAVATELKQLEKRHTRPFGALPKKDLAASFPVDFSETWPLTKDATENEDANLPSGDTTRCVGRNEPCPCGSGKKYKKCCMQRTG